MAGIPPLNFNPRPPRGGRPAQKRQNVNSFIFQSTPSARRATQKACLFIVQGRISIHALREEGDPLCPAPDYRAAQISIHALREEGDRFYDRLSNRGCYFNPRPPRGGRLDRKQPRVEIEIISIHALREEGDSVATLRQLSKSNFNPRPPRGGRLCEHYVMGKSHKISIHALREEGDSCSA